MNGRKKDQFAYNQCYLKIVVSGFACDQMWPVYLCVHASRTPHEGCTPENSTYQSRFRKNQLNEEEPHRNQPVLSAPLCSANLWWSFQVAHKLAHNNSRLHRNYILLTACSFTCVSTVCVYNAWTRLEPLVSSSGLWLGGLCVCLAVHLCVQVRPLVNKHQEQSGGWLLERLTSVHAATVTEWLGETCTDIYVCVNVFVRERMG